MTLTRIWNFTTKPSANACPACIKALSIIICVRPVLLPNSASLNNADLSGPPSAKVTYVMYHCIQSCVSVMTNKNVRMHMIIRRLVAWALGPKLYLKYPNCDCPGSPLTINQDGICPETKISSYMRFNNVRRESGNHRYIPNKNWLISDEFRVPLIIDFWYDADRR